MKAQGREADEGEFLTQGSSFHPIEAPSQQTVQRGHLFRWCFVNAMSRVLRDGL